MCSARRQDVLIVGAGLSGLVAADLLTRAHLNVLVLEARDRVGGRTHSVRMPAETSAWTDLGGAWTRPHHTEARRLAEELGVARFAQYVEGDGLLDLGPRGVERLAEPSPMTGAARFYDGAQAMSHQLAARLPAGSIVLNAPATAIEVAADGVEVRVQRSIQACETFSARAVIVTLPPRLVAGTLNFQPDLSPQFRQTLLDMPTWMGHASKVFVRYREAFWRDQGLSGFALSGRGPLEEIHDVSSPDGQLVALFGFLSGGPYWRNQTLEQRQQAVIEQLVRLFGPQALTFLTYHEMDWVQEKYTSTAEDAAVPLADFQYGHQAFEEPAFGGRVFWAGTETSAVDGGMLEGAVRSGKRAAYLVQATLMD
nr:FAD-dependent oxidoreductase [Deinococcus humi]